MTHVLVAGLIHDSGLELLRKAPGVTFELVPEITRESYAPLMPKADAVVIRTQPIGAAEIASAPNVKIVSRHGVGYDSVDVPALTARGIPLTIVGDVNSVAVAEHALMLMLAAARQTVAHDAATRGNGWKVRNGFDTVELNGKTLLIVGFGRIGRRVAKLAGAFGMSVLAFDPYADAVGIREGGAEPVATLEAGLQRADFVTLHMPGAQGGALIGPTELKALKPSAILINTARGGLIDEAALDTALREGRVRGAGIDVFVDEPPAPDNPLLSNPRVTLSPHSAGLTQECAARMAQSSVQNVLDYFAGRLDAKLVVNAGKLPPQKLQAPGRS